jgi:hypothetical protein
MNNDENDGDFQNPKRHHRQAVSDKELNERRHNSDTRRPHRPADRRQHDVVAEIRKISAIGGSVTKV